jgi:glycosyltransferase involved in cell wall biosynthesis
LPDSKKIVLITSGQPSLNPRLVKEADALADAGYNVTVLYAYWNDWGATFDELMLPQKKWNAVQIGGSPKKQPFVYFLSRLIHKISNLIYHKVGIKLFGNLAIARSSFFLSRQASKYKADLYIGHNLGALPATIKAAKYNHKPCGFDAEDFHRNEVSNDPNHADVKLKTYIENKYFPQLDYLTASSEQIANAYSVIFANIKPTVILNVFKKNNAEKSISLTQKDTIKLFWFSQNIGINRGLQDVLSALKTMEINKFELHLLGYADPELKHSLLEEYSLVSNIIHFHNPVPSDEIPTFASKFDIGLALEPGFSINNDLALSNKLFTYIQSGLAVIASDTIAQAAFINKYPDSGKLYKKKNPGSFAEALLAYSTNYELLDNTKKSNYKLGQTELNWETESSKFLKIVKQTINNS